MTIDLSGIYQGKNLYVQNPYAPNGVGFCVYEIRVNGETTNDETGVMVVEIDFKNCGLKTGDSVNVQILHKDGCAPKVLNPEVLKP